MYKKTNKNPLTISIVVFSVIVCIATMMVVAGCDSPENSVSKVPQTGPSFKDMNKTYTGPGGYTVTEAEACLSNVGSGLPCISTGTEAVTLLQIIDPVNGVNNIDKPDPGTRFVVAQFKQKNESTISLGFGLLDSKGNYGGPNLIGSDGQTYRANFSRTTPGCSPFPTDNSGLAPGQTVIGCYRYDVPTSVKIVKFVSMFATQHIQGTGTAITWLSE